MKPRRFTPKNRTYSYIQSHVAPFYQKIRLHFAPLLANHHPAFEVWLNSIMQRPMRRPGRSRAYAADRAIDERRRIRGQTLRQGARPGRRISRCSWSLVRPDGLRPETSCLCFLRSSRVAKRIHLAGNCSRRPVRGPDHRPGNRREWRRKRGIIALFLTKFPNWPMLNRRDIRIRICDSQVVCRKASGLGEWVGKR